MSAAASAYGTIICGMSDAKTGSNKGPAARERNAGMSTGTRSSEVRSRSAPSAGSSTIGPGTQQAPVELRAPETLEVDPVGPVGRLHLGQVHAPAT